MGDGSTDSTHAFHAAIAASLDVFVPNGSFVIRTTLKLRDRQTLRGSGEWISELLFRPQPSLAPTAGAIAFHGNASNPLDTNAASHGVVVRSLALRHADRSGKNGNRGIDMTAAQLAHISHVKLSFFQTGLFLSRGVDAAGCWFNNVENIDSFNCQYALDINNDCGFSVNNCNFRELHAESTGTWASGGRSEVAYRVRGYGHHLSNIYSSGLQGPASACLEFADTAMTPHPAHGISPCSPGVSVSGDNHVEGLYCESAPTFAIKVTNTTQGRGGNRVESVHLDGQIWSAEHPAVHDPYGEITVQGWSQAGLTTGLAWRLGGVELHSLGPSQRPACTGNRSDPGCKKGNGSAAHASFWRPAGEAAGRSAGSISSNKAGTATHYGTAAGERALLKGRDAAPLEGSLDRVRRGPVARSLVFEGAQESHEGFLASELASAVPAAVATAPEGKGHRHVDHSKLVPLLWSAVQELAAELEQVRAAGKAMGEEMAALRSEMLLLSGGGRGG